MVKLDSVEITVEDIYQQIVYEAEFSHGVIISVDEVRSKLIESGVTAKQVLSRYNQSLIRDITCAIVENGIKAIVESHGGSGWLSLELDDARFNIKCLEARVKKLDKQVISLANKLQGV